MKFEITLRVTTPDGEMEEREVITLDKGHDRHEDTGLSIEEGKGKHQKPWGNRPARRVASTAQFQIPSAPSPVPRSFLTQADLELSHGSWCSPADVAAAPKLHCLII